jgi:hypothetical protein
LVPHKSNKGSKDSANPKTTAVDNTTRRQWDRVEYEKKAAEKEAVASKKDDDGDAVLEARRRKRLERDPLHQGLIVERSMLKGRDFQLDLASRLGKTQVSYLYEAVGIQISPLSFRHNFAMLASKLCPCYERYPNPFRMHLLFYPPVV